MKTVQRLFAVLLVTSAAPAAQTAQDNAAAPARQKVSYRVAGGNTKYTQQQVIDVGDVPGHQLRIFELHRTFQSAASVTNGGQNNAPMSAGTSANAASPAQTASEAPTFNGVKATDSWTQGVSDYVNANGRVYGYGTYMMENGDKIFFRFEGINQAAAGGKANGTFVNAIIGGTGKFKELRGLIRSNTVTNFAGGRATGNETQYEGEYWLER